MFPNGLDKAESSKTGKAAVLIGCKDEFLSEPNQSSTSRTCTQVAGGRIIPLMEISNINTGIIQIIFPCCYTNLMVIMQNLTPGWCFRRNLIGAREYSEGGRGGSPTYMPSSEKGKV